MCMRNILKHLNSNIRTSCGLGRDVKFTTPRDVNKWITFFFLFFSIFVFVRTRRPIKSQVNSVEAALELLKKLSSKIFPWKNNRRDS